VAVRLRLRRVGKKKKPIYHIVAADSRAARNGKFLDVVGRYEPIQNPMVIVTKDDRVMYWLKNGALPTDTVKSLFQRTGLWLRWSLMKKKKDEATIAAEMEKWQMMQETKRQKEIERKARRKARRKAAAAPAGTAPGAAAPAAAVPAAAAPAAEPAQA
jgi:small subunit ribosomal protein S16